VSLTIKAVPADADPRATRIARFLAEKLETVGVEARVIPTSRETLYRDVLVNERFDLYVGRFPPREDPDFLRPLLHSRFAAEAGWQNPFGFADLEVDRLLERQRRQTGSARRETLARLQRKIVRTQPFTVIAFPDEIRGVRSDRWAGWNEKDIHTPLGYLSLDRTSGTSASGPRLVPGTGEGRRNGTRERPEVRMALTDGRALENLNPLAVAFRDRGAITGLLYDPLGRRIHGRVRPWLADAWQWVEPGDDGHPGLEVRLRDELRWHDGRALTADDVAFTYRFLRDTSLGRVEHPVPAQRFRGPVSLVSGVETDGDRTVRLRVRSSSRRVGERALTVPVLPAHIWADKATQATIAGIDTTGTVTEALVWNNQQPVGSGPLRFESLQAREELALERFDDHFLTRSPQDPHLAPYRSGFEPRGLRFRRAPSAAAAVSMVSNGSVDAVATGVLPDTIRQIGRNELLRLHVDRTRAFYHVGFNARRRVTRNPRFRRAVAQLLDRPYLVEEVYEGYAAPAASPLARHRALAPDLAWTGTAPELPFLGDDGQLDAERARRAFREAGYRYSDDGNLLTA